MHDLNRNNVPDFVPIGRRESFGKEEEAAKKKKMGNGKPPPPGISKNNVSQWFLWNSLINSGLDPHSYMQPPYDIRDEQLERHLEKLERETYKRDSHLGWLFSFRNDSILFYIKSWFYLQFCLEDIVSLNRERFRKSKRGVGFFVDSSEDKTNQNKEFDPEAIMRNDVSRKSVRTNRPGQDPVTLWVFFSVYNLSYFIHMCFFGWSGPEIQRGCWSDKSKANSSGWRSKEDQDPPKISAKGCFKQSNDSRGYIEGG